MNRHFACLAAAGIVTLGLTVTAEPAPSEDSWPTFRGADRDAVAAEANLLTRWPEDGPKLLWSARGAGRGYASLAIAGGRIYTLGDQPSTASDKDEYLLCFDQSSGDPVWKAKTGEPWDRHRQESWQSSRSTPTVDGDRVYVLTAYGELIAFTTAGKELWRKNLKEDFSGDKADGWGYSESVTIDGDKLLCTPGGEENTLVALNKKTGEKIWSASRPDDRGAGHASIVISNIGDTKVYVQVTGSGPMGVRASDGKLLWDYDIGRTTAVIPTPIVRDDLVFFTAGYGRGGALLRQEKTASGDIGVKEIYPLNPQLQNKHGGVVLVGDYLYGDSGDSGRPFCAKLTTGEIAWKGRGAGRGSACVAAADGHVYFRYQNGVMTLVKADPDEFQEEGTFEIPGSGDRPSWSHPVILDGKLYLREGDSILCYDVSS